MVRECRPPARRPMSSWLARRSTMATSTSAKASSAANIRPVGPPPAITTACSVIATLRSAPRRSWKMPAATRVPALVRLRTNRMSVTPDASRDSLPLDLDSKRDYAARARSCRKRPGAPYTGSGRKEAHHSFSAEQQALCCTAARRSPWLLPDLPRCLASFNRQKSSPHH